MSKHERESYGDYMGRKMRESRNAEQPLNNIVTLFNRIETLEKRVEELEKRT